MNFAEIPLPRFIEHRADGLYIDLGMQESGAAFPRFAEQIFSGGDFFADLNYPVFQHLLYAMDHPTPPDASAKEVRHHWERLARAILPFSAERQSLYRGVTIAPDGANAAYLFEPIFIGREHEVVEYAPPDALGNTPVTGTRIELKQEVASLSVDEFIAAMWAKGVRFGLNIRAITAAIQSTTNSQKGQRIVIAEARPATPGVGASIIEQSKALHRDDSPRLLPNGRMDLQCFANRFPQIAAGTQLLKKIPRVLGQHGYTVTGARLESDLPPDFDFATLAGPGTQVDSSAKGEFIVAAQDGFLHIDQQSQQISITDKIISTQGVNMRTTGNLSLTGSDFEEQGEVQERRVVEGHNMVFLNNVFGHVVSVGGVVELRAALTGGSVKNRGGKIQISGAVSNAWVEDRRGCIELESAESSLIVARQVRIKRAVNCAILADEVEIETCIGSGVSARELSIERTEAWRNQETIIALHRPDPALWDKEQAKLAAELERLHAAIQHAGETLQRESAQEEFKSFLQLQKQVGEGSIKLNPTQEIAWQAMRARFALQLEQFSALHKEQQRLKAREPTILARQAAIESERQAAEARVKCVLAQVAGDTVVRTCRVVGDDLPFTDLPAKELQARLRERGLAADILFADNAGNFCWPLAAEL